MSDYNSFGGPEQDMLFQDKLIVLFLFDKMGVPLDENSVVEICTADNQYMNFVSCKQAIFDLLEVGCLYKIKKSDLVNITSYGLNCLSVFYTRIPMSIRESITVYVKNNRMKFRKKQAYRGDYIKNEDGSYTVILKILNDTKTLMELRMVVTNLERAKYIYNNWESRASLVYANLQDVLID